MVQYIETHDESKCCGCGACKEICSKNALKLIPNREGFLYPVLDKEKCIGCKMCEKVCPEMALPEKKAPGSVYAIQYNDKNILKNSSSGGAFRLLADYFIKNGGVVVGCIWNDNMEPILEIAYTLEELIPMQGSKYLSSRTNDIYQRIEVLLKNGRTVLFTGTPCQCAGLLKYLRESYNNLYTMDFLCHGVPSQKAFDAFKQYLENRHNGEITSYSFRDKDKNGWSHTESYVIKGRKYYKYASTNTYLFGFLGGLFSRYCCYNCHFQDAGRFTDFSVCDYWGYEKYHHIINYFDGISGFQVNTTHAEAVFNDIQDDVILHKTKREFVSVANPRLSQHTKEEIPTNRKNIYDRIESEGWEKVEKTFLRSSHWHIKKLFEKIPISFQRRIKRIVKGK